MEASKAEKFGEFKPGVEVALNRKREDEDLGRVHPSPNSSCGYKKQILLKNFHTFY